MHILFLTENFPPEVNAIASRVYERACLWVEAGHKVTVVTCFPNFPQGRIYPGYRQKLRQRETIDGIEVIRAATYVARNEGFVRRTLDFVSFLVAPLLAASLASRPDVVVSTSPQFFAGMAGWFAGITQRRPFVLELADLWPASIVAVGAMRPGLLLRMLERLELFLYRRAAAIVTLTRPFKEDLVRRGVPAGKVAVVINGADLRRYQPQPRDAALAREHGLEGRFVVGYIGTHGMAHALENVLEAAALLSHRDDIRFLFVGDGAARPALVRMQQERHLRNVLLLPAQPKSSMPKFWSTCDLALVHLKNDRVFSEVIPSKMFEAMAMGLPLLTVAPAGEATRITEEHGVGVTVPAEQPQALADAVSALADDRARVRELAQVSQQSAQLFSRRRQAQDLMRVLEAVVDGQGGRAAEYLER